MREYWTRDNLIYQLVQSSSLVHRTFHTILQMLFVLFLNMKKWTITDIYDIILDSKYSV